MSDNILTVETYLTVQIQEIVGYGALHVLTWARNDDLRHWLQLSVHHGDGCYLMVQCVLTEQTDKHHLDRIFHQTGWVNMQADRGDALVYYLARSRSDAELKDRVPEAAQRCTEAISALWNVATVEQLALVGARGPRLTLQPLQATADSGTPQALTA
jgi:hypothetical protein